MKEYGIVSRERLLVKQTRDGRSVYSRSGKQALIAACAQEGASIAAIALSHGVNANLLHKWLRLDRGNAGCGHAQTSVAPGTPAASLMPVVIAPSPRVNPEQQANLINTASATRPCAALVIEIAGARLVIQSGAIDRTTLSAVIACLREPASR